MNKRQNILLFVTIIKTNKTEALPRLDPFATQISRIPERTLCSSSTNPQTLTFEDRQDCGLLPTFLSFNLVQEHRRTNSTAPAPAKKARSFLCLSNNDRKNNSRRDAGNVSLILRSDWLSQTTRELTAAVCISINTDWEKLWPCERFCNKRL